MCYDADAVPPVHGPPLMAAKSSSVVLTSTDGARFAGFLAQPEHSRDVGVVVLPDNRGLSGFYERFAVRLAEQGYPTLAIDYFGRTAGTDIRARADFPFMEHLGRLTKDGLHGDIGTAADHLRGPEGRPVVSLGFCMGGRLAFISALPKFGLAGAIGLYGYPDPINGAPGPTQLAAELTGPILAMFGGADEHIPAEVVESFGGALASHEVEHEIITYPGAPHGFFELGRPELADTSADAWSRILASSPNVRPEQGDSPRRPDLASGYHVQEYGLIAATGNSLYLLEGRQVRTPVVGGRPVVGVGMEALCGRPGAGRETRVRGVLRGR